MLVQLVNTDVADLLPSLFIQHQILVVLERCAGNYRHLLAGVGLLLVLSRLLGRLLLFSLEPFDAFLQFFVDGSLELLGCQFLRRFVFLRLLIFRNFRETVLVPDLEELTHLSAAADLQVRDDLF